jgi:hypothetical protein
VGGGGNMVRVLKIEGVNQEKTLFRVTIEKGGKQYSFVIDAWELLDDARFINILRDWETRIIPKKEVVESLTPEEREKRALAKVGLEVT